MFEIHATKKSLFEKYIIYFYVFKRSMLAFYVLEFVANRLGHCFCQPSNFLLQ